MQVSFQELGEGDMNKVRDIYNFYILNTTATFHTEKISVEELNQSIYIGHPLYKSYLILAHDQVCGFCFLTHFKKRQAYDRTAEISIYLRPEFKAKGIGRQALELLEEQAEKKGIRVIIAVITHENEASIKLFEKTGYEKCAHYKQVGMKFNKLLDVVAYQKILVSRKPV
jgi:phosphinothricin acetyltransferase